MHLAAFLSVLTAVIGVLSFAAAVLRGLSKNQVIKDLQVGNDELRKQIDDKDKIILGLNKDREICDAKLEAASKQAEDREKARLEALELAQSRPAFETLGTQMIKQHKELLQAIGRQTNSFTNAMTKLTKEVMKNNTKEQSHD